MQVKNDATLKDPVLTIAEAAKLARVSTKTIYRALDAGALRCSNLGQRKGYRTRESWLNEWINRNAQEVRAVSELEVRSPTSPPRTARRGPYAAKQTPRRGFLK